MTLRPGDAAFAKEVVERQRALFAELWINLWWVDVDMQATAGAFDLLGDFSGPKNFGVKGRLWVELKVFGCDVFEERVQEAREKLLPTLEREKSKGDGLAGVLLVAAKVEELRGASWNWLTCYAALRTTGGTQWQDLVGFCPRVARGQSLRKPSWATVSQELEWHDSVSGEKVALLSQLLQELNLDHTRPGDRAKFLNKRLRRTGHEPVRREKVLNRAGRSPWVANADTLRQCQAALL